MSNTYMRLFLVIPLLVIPLFYSPTYAEEWKEWRTIHTTEHPPHDHHQTDHLKKLDEWLARRRQQKKSIR